MNSYRLLLIERDKVYNSINEIAKVRHSDPDIQIRLGLQRKKLKDLYNFYTKLLKELDKEVKNK